MALKFAPFGSEIELPFYTALSQFKIDFDTSELLLTDSKLNQIVDDALDSKDDC